MDLVGLCGFDFVLDFSFLKRNIQPGGREKQWVMQSAQHMGPAVMDETKGPSSLGCCPAHEWEREHEKQSMYRVVLAARFVPCHFLVKLNFEWGAVIWKPQFKSGCGRELMRVRRWSWSEKSAVEGKGDPLLCLVVCNSIPQVRGCPRESTTINATVWIMSSGES